MGQAGSESWCAKNAGSWCADNVLPSQFPPHARVWRRRPHQAALTGATRTLANGQSCPGGIGFGTPPKLRVFDCPAAERRPGLAEGQASLSPSAPPESCLLRMDASNNAKIQKRYGYGSDKYGSDIGVGQCKDTDRTSTDNDKIRKREAIEDLRLRRDLSVRREPLAGLRSCGGRCGRRARPFAHL